MRFYVWKSAIVDCGASSAFQFLQDQGAVAMTSSVHQYRIGRRRLLESFVLPA